MLTDAEVMCDPSRPLGAAIRLAQKQIQSYPSYDIQICGFLKEQCRLPAVDMPTIERALLILAAIGSEARLRAALRSALTHPDPRVRSKSALLLTRRILDLDWLKPIMCDWDPRVRANIVESLWGRTGLIVENAFLAAMEDAHHRVVANALYGLCLIDPARHLNKVDLLVNHPSPLFRAAAAWFIGKAAEDGKVTHNGSAELLKQMMRDDHAEVRNAAVQALAKVNAPPREAVEIERLAS